jgi:hypothetical protein
MGAAARMAAVSAYFEKKGVPTVVEITDLPNVKRFAKEMFLFSGVPEVRSVFIAPAKWREKCPDEDLPKFLEALTKPLTDAEKRSGKYRSPEPPRIAMTGTYGEVQDFFAGDLSAFVDTAPTARWTDGLPITPPTQEAVSRMLKGTGHKPDEIVHPAMGPMKRVVTVEKVAINAVMAGCKPEHLPLCLAITAEGLTNPWSSNSSFGLFNIVSGPIAKQIGMNSGAALMSPGNPANMAVTRFTALALKNLYGATPGINYSSTYGTAFLGMTVAESPDTPWETLNVRYGFSPKESVIIQLKSKVGILGRAVGEATLQRTKEAALPAQLVATMKALTPTTGGQGRIIIVNPDIARIWRSTFGWDTMAKLQDYLWDNTTWPRRNYDLSYWWGTRDPFDKQKDILKAPRGARELNPDHIEAPPDALVPINNSPLDYIILVAGGPLSNYTETVQHFSWGVHGGYTVLPIDKWK